MSSAKDANSSQSTPVWVVGHKNPDTDSICAAIAYAYFKNQVDDRLYIPKKAGPINEETRFALSSFGVREPDTVQNVGIQLKDIHYNRALEGVSGHLSLKKAWEMMKEKVVVTLPITSIDDRVLGLIVNGDLTYSYMDIYDNDVLSKARTPYRNILETVEGKLICGNEHASFVRGKVVVAAGNRAKIHDEVEGDDLVIVGDVVERQFAILEEIPSCMIVTGVSNVDPEVIKTADAIECVLITTEYDSFTTARLINQAIPIDYFMTRENLIVFHDDDYIDEVKEIMTKIRHRDFPILDANEKYLGMFSRRHLLLPRKKQVILVDHNEKSQAVDGIEEAEILEIIDHHKIGSLETISPIYFRNMPLGCCSTIIYGLYREHDVPVPEDMAGVMLSAILSDTLMFRSPTCTETDRQAAEELAEIAGVEIESYAMQMFEAGSNFGDKTPEQLIYTDFKTFVQGEVNYGVSQVSAVTDRQLDAVKDGLADYMEKAMQERKLDMVYVMLTNILDQRTRLLMGGKDADKVARRGFPDGKMMEDTLFLDGVVSRKKQMIPGIISGLIEEET